MGAIAKPFCTILPVFIVETGLLRTFLGYNKIYKTLFKKASLCVSGSGSWLLVFVRLLAVISIGCRGSGNYVLGRSQQ